MRGRVRVLLAGAAGVAATWSGLTLLQARSLRQLPSEVKRPQLIFFAEREPELLQRFLQPEVLGELAANGWGLSVALLQLDGSTADLVASVLACDIPVYAWLTLPREEGYWLSTDNWRAAAAVYDRFSHWAREHDLQFSGVVLDMETPYEESRSLARAIAGGWWPTIRWYLARERRPNAFATARAAYQGMVDRIRSEGREAVVVTYPAVLDDRRDGDADLQGLLRVVDLPGARRVFMVYRTAFDSTGKRLGAAPIASYGRDLDGDELAVGNLLDETYGLAELQADLQVAARYSRRIWIYSLEGAVTRGLLGELAKLDYTGTPYLSLREAWRTTVLRQGVLAGDILARSWARWVGVAVVLAGAWWLVSGMRGLRQKSREMVS